jgi:signal transduction histidine kinase
LTVANRNRYVVIGYAGAVHFSQKKEIPSSRINAIKYNHAQGWVRLQVETVAGWVSIHISDSGPGLDALQQARLFQPFERLGAQRGPVAGTGLGLALSRELVEAMGGSITVRSEAGAGATFTISLPAG